jgi:hypothetical protein
MKKDAPARAQPDPASAAVASPLLCQAVAIFFFFFLKHVAIHSVEAEEAIL